MITKSINRPVFWPLKTNLNQRTVPLIDLWLNLKGELPDMKTLWELTKEAAEMQEKIDGLYALLDELYD